jgi:hypothetical protein
MTQEQKDLLLKDLCARLPYEIKADKYTIRIDGEFVPIANIEIVTAKDILARNECPGYTIKPYLFPLSSMTEEQKQEYTYIVNYISSDDTENWKEGEFIYVEQFSQLMHFYHINHLDYMGLIPMGLANDATGLNIY